MGFSKAKFLAPLAAVLALLMAVVYFTGHDGEGIHKAKADGVGVAVATATDINPQGSGWPAFFGSFSGYSDPIDADYDLFGNPAGAVGTFLLGDDNVGTLPISNQFPTLGTAEVFIPGMPAFAVIPTDTQEAPGLVWAACGGRFIQAIEVREQVEFIGKWAPICLPVQTVTTTVSGTTGAVTALSLGNSGSNLRFQITSGNGFIINKNSGFNLGVNVNCTDDMSSGIFDNGVVALQPPINSQMLPASVCDVDHEIGAIGVLVAPSASLTNGVIKVDVSDDDGSISTQRIFGVRNMAAFALDQDAPITTAPAEGSSPVLVAYNCRETSEPCGRNASLFVDVSIPNVLPTSIAIDDSSGFTLDNMVHFFISNGGIFVDPVGTALQGCQGQEITVIDGRWYGTVATLLQDLVNLPFGRSAGTLGACDFDGAYNGVATAFMVPTSAAGATTVTAQQGAANPGEAPGPVRSVTLNLSGQSPVPLRTVALVAGRCNPVALTFAPGTPVAQVAAAVTATAGTPPATVSGAAAVASVWMYVPSTNSFVGFDPTHPTAPISDYLTTQAFLEVASICVKPDVTNAQIVMPGVTGP